MGTLNAGTLESGLSCADLSIYLLPMCPSKTLLPENHSRFLQKRYRFYNYFISLIWLLFLASLIQNSIYLNFMIYVLLN
jgi:hypothetical protein